MRSTAVRVTIGAIAWIGLAVGAFLLIRSERHINDLSASLRAFDRHAREASDALEEARVAQHGYVAAGQGEAFWMNKLSASMEFATAALTALEQSASATGRTTVGEASATATEFLNIDRRVRDYLASDQRLMAADVIFTEGSDAAATAGRQVETARLAEHQAFDRDVADIRRQEAVTLAATAAGVGILVLLLIPVRRSSAEMPVPAETGITNSIAHSAAPAPAATDSATPHGRASGLFRAAAVVATDFGRVRDLEELTRVLGRAAELIDATGLMVWMGDGSGADIRPVLAHGYSAQMIARMPPIARSADNAAAAAYRSGALQIVLSRPGGGTGAVVAPIMAADGCIGALSAEIRGGGETSESIQALATIFAAHLAGVLAPTPGDSIGAQPKAAAQA
jgi:hypothetical protein